MSELMLKVTVLFAVTCLVSEVMTKTISHTYTDREKALIAMDPKGEMKEHKVFLLFSVLAWLTKPAAALSLLATAILWVVGT